MYQHIIKDDVQNIITTVTIGKTIVTLTTYMTTQGITVCKHTFSFMLYQQSIIQSKTEAPVTHFPYNGIKS